MTKKEILKLLEPFGDEAEIFIDYKGTLKLSLSILNDCEEKASSVKHVGETIKVDFNSRNNYGIRVFINEENKDECSK